ncbi:MAG: amidohydrolase family protein [Candidatus Aminicenantes bacterium]|nr:amidohydrolase family protein [Candidatus Aminicenantes bacterium]
MIEDGMILIEEGKIIRVGKNFPVPSDAVAIEADTVIPGLVDMHSHAGVFTLPLVEANMDGNEVTDPITPQLRALDSFNFSDPHLRMALSGGVTTIVSRPGSANIIGGTSIAVKLKDAPPEQMILKEICDLKMTIEYNPVEFYGRKNRMPSSLMTVYFLARKAFIEARQYMREWEKYDSDKKAGKEAVPPHRDLGKDALVMALKREIPVHVHVITASEIMSAIRLADEFNLQLTLAHVPLAYLVVDELAKRKDVHLNVGPTQLQTYYQDGLRLRNNAAILADAGIPISLQADTVGEFQSNLLYLASMAVRYGLNKEDALKAVTIHGAKGVNLDHRIGSIEEGKDADLVFLNGEPFEMTTSVETVMIDGRIEYRSDEERHSKFETSIPDSLDELLLPPRFENPKEFAVKFGAAFTMTGPPLKEGVLLIKEGKIEKIGSDVSIPEGWPVLDAGEFVVMPGLVNSRSYVGIGVNWRRISSVDETAKPVVPEMEVKHAIDPQSPDFTFARQLGVTTAMVTPGNKNVIGGQGCIIKNSGMVADEMVVREKAVMVFGLGDSAKRRNQMPSTRMGVASLLRETLIRAREYDEQKKTQEIGPNSNRDFSMEALLPVLKGEIPALIHCERKDDILTALGIADEFHLKIILAGATDAYKAAEEIKEKDIPVVLERVYRRSQWADDRDFSKRNPSILASAGIRVAFKPEEGGQWTRPAVSWGGGDLLEIAALAVKHGMTEDAALRAITIDAAGIIGLSDRVGSLEPGKDADFLILRGHPLRVRSLPQAVFINGKLVYCKEEGEHIQ